MSALVVVETAASIIAGWTVVEIAFAAGSRSSQERCLRLSIGVLLGLGILSVAYAVALFAELDHRIELALPVALAASGGGFLLWRRRGKGEPAFVDEGVRPARQGLCDERRPDRMLRTLFVAAALVAATTALEHTFREPEGGFDAWAIWNSRARFLFRAASPALEAFSPALARAQFRAHPDYPLLVPGLVVEGFRWIGGESVVVPALVAIAFAVLLVSLVAFGVAELLGRRWGLLAGSILLSAPVFVTLAVRQCADVPLAAFVFAASLIAVFADRSDPSPRSVPLLALAGFTLSFAAWSKNEGIVFLLVVPIAFLLRPAAGRRIDRRLRAAEALSWAAGALPVVLLLVVFKLHFAPRNDLLPSSGAEILSRLLEPGRWAMLARAVLKRAVDVHEWGLHLLATMVVASWLVVRRWRGVVVDPMARSIALALPLVALSFAAAYLLTPHDVEWQVRHTFDRLAFQCWPTALLAMFLVVARMTVKSEG